MARAFSSLALVLAGLLSALPGGGAMAQDSTGIALPGDGGMGLWDMRRDPPVALAKGLPDSVVAGMCYTLSGRRLAPQKPGAACLDYYTFTQPLAGLERFSAKGRIAFNGIAPDHAYRGLELRGVHGITDCGERDGCDTVYIAGFADPAVTAQAFAAARAGQMVSLTGRQFWNAESLDMIVEKVTPAR